MRIGFDARMVEWSGVGRYSRNLLRALSEVAPDNDYVLFCNQDGAQSLPEGGTFERVFVNLEVFKFSSLFSLSGPLRRAKLDLFHSPHFVSPITKSCPVVNTIHDLIPLAVPAAMPSYLSRLRYRRLNKWALSRADAVIAVSNFTKGQILERFKVDPERLFVIPEAADPALAEYADAGELAPIKRRHGISGDYLLAFGHTKAHKNTSGLIKAFAGVKSGAAEGEQLQLVLMGDERLARRFKPLITELGLTGADLVIVPFLEDRALAAVYRGAAAFIMPSLIEGFGLPVLEAMACGVPVICSNQASLPEVADGAAAMFDPFDPADMENVISGVLADKERRLELAALGSARAKTFSWERTAKATLKVYERLL